MRKAQYTLISFIIAAFILLSLVGVVANITVEKTNQLNKTQLLIKLGDVVRAIHSIQEEERQVSIDFTDVHLGMLGGWPRGVSKCGSYTNQSSDWLIKSTPYWFSSPDAARFFTYTADTDCINLINDCKSNCPVNDNKCKSDCELEERTCIYSRTKSMITFHFVDVSYGLYEVIDDNGVVRTDFTVDGNAGRSEVLLSAGGHSIVFTNNLPNSITLRRVIPTSGSISCSLSDSSFSCDGFSCSVSESLNCDNNKHCFISDGFVSCVTGELLSISNYCSLGVDSFICGGEDYPFVSFSFIDGRLVSDSESISADGDCIRGDDRVVCNGFSCSITKSLSCDNGVSCVFSDNGINCDNGVSCDSSLNCVRLSEYSSCIPNDSFINGFYINFLNNYFNEMKILAFNQIKSVALNNGLLLTNLVTPLIYNASINGFGSNSLLITFLPINIPLFTLSSKDLLVRYEGSTLVSDAFRSDFASYESSAKKLILNNSFNELINEIINKHSSFSFRSSTKVSGSSFNDYNNFMNTNYDEHWSLDSDSGIELDFSVKPYCIYLLKEGCMFLSDEVPTGLTTHYLEGSRTLFDEFTQYSTTFPEVWVSCKNECGACHDIGLFNNPCINISDTHCQNCFKCLSGSDYDSITDDECYVIINNSVVPVLAEYLSYRLNTITKLFDLPFNVLINTQRVNITSISFDKVVSSNAFESSCFNCKSAIGKGTCLFLNSSLSVSSSFSCDTSDCSDCGGCNEREGIIETDGITPMNFQLIVNNNGDTNERVYPVILIDSKNNLNVNIGSFTAMPQNVITTFSSPQVDTDGLVDSDNRFDYKIIGDSALINHGSSHTFNLELIPADVGLGRGTHRIRICASTDYDDEWDWSDNCVDYLIGSCTDGDFAKSCCEDIGGTWILTPSCIDYGKSGLCCGDDFYISNEPINYDYDASNYINAITIGDFDGDGYDDVSTIYEDVSCENNCDDIFYLLINNGSEYPVSQSITFRRDSYSYLKGVRSIDFDDDGDLDVVMVDSRGRIYVFTNNDGLFDYYSFKINVNYFGVRSFDIGDLDNNGIPDIVLIGSRLNTPSNYLAVVVMNGDYNNPLLLNINLRAIYDVTINDFNNDGLNDFAVSGWRNIGFFYNNGDSFDFSPTAFDVYNMVHITSGDFNGDGNIDLATLSYVSGSQNNLLDLIINNGDGSFTKTQTNIHCINAITTNDFNSDGAFDIGCVNNNVFNLLLSDGSEHSLTLNHGVNQIDSNNNSFIVSYFESPTTFFKTFTLINHKRVYSNEDYFIYDDKACQGGEVITCNRNYLRVWGYDADQTHCVFNPDLMRSYYCIGG